MKVSFAIIASTLMTLAVSVSAAPSPQAPVADVSERSLDVKDAPVPPNSFAGNPFDDGEFKLPAKITKVNGFTVVTGNPLNGADFTDDVLAAAATVVQIKTSLTGDAGDVENVTGAPAATDATAQSQTLNLNPGEVVNLLTVSVGVGAAAGVVGLKMDTNLGNSIAVGIVVPDAQTTEFRPTQPDFGLIGFTGNVGETQRPILALGPIWGKLSVAQAA